LVVREKPFLREGMGHPHSAPQKDEATTLAICVDPIKSRWEQELLYLPSAAFIYMSREMLGMESEE
jgi:hypothetical protein